MDDTDDPLAPRLDAVVEPAGSGPRVVVLRGELDVATLDELDAALAHAAKGGDAPRVLVDLSEVTFVDSTALMRLLLALRDLRRRGGHMALVCSNPTVLRLFEITRTDQTFEIFPTRDRALGHLEAA